MYDLCFDCFKDPKKRKEWNMIKSKEDREREMRLRKKREAPLRRVALNMLREELTSATNQEPKQVSQEKSGK